MPAKDLRAGYGELRSQASLDGAKASRSRIERGCSGFGGECRAETGSVRGVAVESSALNVTRNPIASPRISVPP